MLGYKVVSLFDSLIYKLIATIFKVILYLADIQVLGDDIIGALTRKVYAFLAVLMFFKIAISTIQYIVNPDELSNSDKGIGGILKNSAIAIILLAVVPEIFAFARSKQSYIASYIPTIILDVEYNGVESNKHVELVRSTADDMAAKTFNAFVLKKDGNGTAPIGRATENGPFSWNLARSNNDKDYNDIEQSIYYGCHQTRFFGTSFFWPDEDATPCSYNYLMIWSTISGALMAFVLVSMAVDIAIRAIKLSILEVMAPIPIVSYINKPKGGAFEAWLKECKDVYLDLFIRLIIIYFAVFLIREITDDFGVNMLDGIFASMNGEDAEIKSLVFVFLIVGLLLFAKNAPKFVTDILGIKGNDSISGMFKRAGGLAGSIFGTGRSGITGAINKYNKAKASAQLDSEGRWADKKKRNQALRQAALSGLRSSRSAAWAGTRSAFSGKGFKETRDASIRAADRAFDLYEARKDSHVSWTEYQKELLKRRIGIRQDLEVLNAEIKAAQESSDKAKAALDYVHNNLGAKFADVRFGNDYLKRMQHKIDDSKLKGEFVIGVNDDGSLMKVSMDDMGEGGKYSINTVMSRLQSTIKDEDGSLRKNFVDKKMKDLQPEIDKHSKAVDAELYAADAKIDADLASGSITSAEATELKEKALKDAIDKKDKFLAQKRTEAEMGATQIQSDAQKMLDDLQGFADQFIVGVAGLSTDSLHARATKDYKTRVGFSDNPAFSRIIEEAKAAIITNSATSFGIETAAKGRDSSRAEGRILNDHGKVLEGMLGDWLALNKKAGQDAQTANISAQTNDSKVAAQAAAKKIADQYDKKS